MVNVKCLNFHFLNIAGHFQEIRALKGGAKVAGGECSTLEMDLFKNNLDFLYPHLYLISADQNLKKIGSKSVDERIFVSRRLHLDTPLTAKPLS